MYVGMINGRLSTVNDQFNDQYHGQFDGQFNGQRSMVQRTAYCVKILTAGKGGMHALFLVVGVEAVRIVWKINRLH